MSLIVLPVSIDSNLKYFQYSHILTTVFSDTVFILNIIIGTG